MNFRDATSNKRRVNQQIKDTEDSGHIVVEYQRDIMKDPAEQIPRTRQGFEGGTSSSNYDNPNAPFLKDKQNNRQKKKSKSRERDQPRVPSKEKNNGRSKGMKRRDDNPVEQSSASLFDASAGGQAAFPIKPSKKKDAEVYKEKRSKDRSKQNKSKDNGSLPRYSKDNDVDNSQLMNFHHLQQRSQEEDLSSEDGSSVAVPINDGSGNKKRKAQKNEQLTPPKRKATPQNEQSDSNQSQLNKPKKAPKEVQNKNGKRDKNGKSSQNEQLQDQKNSQMNGKYSRATQQQNGDQRGESRQKQRKPRAQANSESSSEDERYVKPKKKKDKPTFIQETSILQESSMEQLIGSQNGHSKNGVDKSKKSSKITVVNGQNSKTKKQSRDKPISVDYSMHLKNEQDQDIQDNIIKQQVEEKKFQIWSNLKQGVKSIMQKPRKSKTVEKVKGPDKEGVAENNKEQNQTKKPRSSSVSVDPAKDSQEKKEGADSKNENQSQNKANTEPEGDDNKSSSTLSKSTEVDLDDANIDREEYWKALRKKQRKNFIGLLKNKNAQKSKHEEELKKLEKDPRDIMMDLKKNDNEEQEDLEKTLYVRMQQKASRCLERGGCKRLQKCFFKQVIQREINESESGYRARKYQHLRNLKMQEKERSDAERLWKQRIIKLNHPIRVRWDVLIICFTIYNCIELPIEVGFKWRNSYDSDNISSHINILIDIFFGIDIIFNFFTTYFHATTGEEICEKKEIARNYLRGQFFIDLMSTIPFDNVASLFMSSTDDSTSENLQTISMLKTIRVFRLSKLIAFLNATDEIKLNLQLLKTIFLILLYIHILACIWYAYGEQGTDAMWIPGQPLEEGKDNFFHDYDMSFKFFVSFYTSVLALCGNDIYPVEVPLQYMMGCVYLLMGALMQAYMFGNLAVMVQQLNRKSQNFQEKLDLANTSMRNMQLKEDIQQDIRDFMTRTQSNLDNQKELNQFLQIISPSLRCQVTQHIFEQAIKSNPLFKEKQEDIMEFLINKIEPKLFLPEDIIFQQNENNEKFLCFIARGKCEVSVNNNMRKSCKQQDIGPGNYFGEICLIYDCPRTATVQSMDYSIFAHLSQTQFHELWNYSPDCYDQIKQEIVKNYNDEWIKFKIKLLKQVDYFKKVQNEEFFHEIQFFMQEKIYQRGNYILEVGNRCEELMFVVNGIVEIQVQDRYLDYHVVEKLEQGSLIGQFAVHSDKPIFISAKASSAVRLLTLPRQFFECFGLESTLSKNVIIDGLEEACHKAKKEIDKLKKYCRDDEIKKFSLPMCDFKLYERIDQKDVKRRCKRHMKRAGNRAKIMFKINKKGDDKMKIKGLMVDLKRQIKKEEDVEKINQGFLSKFGNLQALAQPKVDEQLEQPQNSAKGSARKSDASGARPSMMGGRGVNLTDHDRNSVQINTKKNNRQAAHEASMAAAKQNHDERERKKQEQEEKAKMEILDEQRRASVQQMPKLFEPQKVDQTEKERKKKAKKQQREQRMAAQQEAEFLQEPIPSLHSKRSSFSNRSHNAHLVDQELFGTNVDKLIQHDVLKEGNTNMIARRKEVMDNFRDMNEETLVKGIDNSQSMPANLKKAKKKRAKNVSQPKKKKKEF